MLSRQSHRKSIARPPAVFLAFIAVCAAASAQAPGGGAIPDISARILAGAKEEARLGARYLEEYRILEYPGGDVPSSTGVCTDFVIRACRRGGFDLQPLLYQDRVAHPEAYPTQIWDNKRADRNIDHRRCQNLTVWFGRNARALTTSLDRGSLAEWKPGDIVFYVREKQTHPWHVAVVSDRRDADGMPFVLENYPPRAGERYRLDQWAPVHSHYRMERMPEPAGRKNPRPQD